MFFCVGQTFAESVGRSEGMTPSPTVRILRTTLCKEPKQTFQIVKNYGTMKFIRGEEDQMVVNR